MPKMKQGFTLVELSIVLVIIGLLIGGILVAQSMIGTAKIQRFIRDLQQYEVAVRNFKTNYGYLPGDDPSFSPPGNGNGIIESQDNGCIDTYMDNELEQAFGHLSESGMLQNYLPYEPSSCGGNQSSLSSANMPVHELDAKASASLTSQGYFSYQGKSLIYFLLNFEGTNPSFSFYVSANEVIPLETKLGSVSSITNNDFPVIEKVYGEGLYNLAGKYNCIDNAGIEGATIYNCNDSRSVIGKVNYFFKAD